MRIKDKQKKPDTVTDLFEGLDVPIAIKSNLKSAKKFVMALLKDMSKQKNPSVHEFHQIQTNLKNIREIKIYAQIELEYSGKIYSYNFLRLKGSFIPEYMLKEIYDCNFLDVKIMSVGCAPNSKNKINQLFTAIAITLATVIGSIIKEELPIKTTLGEGFQLIQKIIKTYENDYQQKVQEPIKELLQTIELYYQLDIDNKDISKPNYPDSIQDANKHPDQSYTEVVEHLEKAINQCITIGLFKQYQRSPNSNKKIENIPVICEGHTLLNNTKLLKKLNGSTLNLEGNSKKKQIYNAFDKKIIDLISDNQYEKRYKNKTELYRVLAEGISEQLYEYMKNHRQDNNHKNGLMPDNLATRIRTIINKNDDLKKKFLQQFEK